MIKILNSSEGQGVATLLKCSHHFGLPHYYLNLCEEDKMIIYQVKNKINEKPYIGYSMKFNSSEDFLQNNFWGSGLLIKKAIKKYGIENFERKVLLKNISDFKELNRYEILWIQKKNTKTPNGYNITDGGGGGDTFTNNPNKEITREKRKAMVGEKNSLFGKPKSEIHKQHLRKPKSEIAKEHMRKPKSNTENMKKPKSELHKEHLRKPKPAGYGESRKGKNNPMFGRKGELSPMFGIQRFGADNPNFGNRGEQNPLYGKKRPDHAEFMRERARIIKEKKDENNK